MPHLDAKPTRTLVILKPDAIERNLVGEILRRFERKGFKIVKAEMRWADEELAKQHYYEHKDNPNWFNKMVDAITAGPVLAVILEGVNAVAASRQLIGNASPVHDSQIGTIRADLSIQEPFNLVHGSDSNAAANREIALWFDKGDVGVNAEDELVTKPVKDFPKKKKPILPSSGILPNKGKSFKYTPADIEQAKTELFDIIQAHTHQDVEAPKEKVMA